MTYYYEKEETSTERYMALGWRVLYQHSQLAYIAIPPSPTWLPIQSGYGYDSGGVYIPGPADCPCFATTNSNQRGICNVPLVALTDFDIRPFDDIVDDILLDCSYMGDTYLQRRLAIMFIETVKLCQCQAECCSPSTRAV